MLKTFVKPVLLYGLSINVYCKVDKDKLKVVQNTARWMMLGTHNRGQMVVKMLAEKVPLKVLAAQLQKRRLNRWANLHKTAIK